MAASRFIIIYLSVIAAIIPVTLPGEAFAAAKHHAAKPHHHKHKKTVASNAGADSGNRFSALVVDADSGAVLYEKNADSARYPASLTKMMTLYLTFDALNKGKLKMDQALAVSAKAAGQAPTNISLSNGDRLPVETAIESVVVRSANDSAMVLAEALGGTAWNFSLMMTQKAHELGMDNTVFRNPSGLPDNGQHTCALDMARLAIALRRDFPQYYHYFKMTSFSFNGITYPGHNHVMARYDGVDGVKTGYIRASGYNLVTSAHKNGNNIVAVIMGGSTITSRDDQMIALLDRTFAQLDAQHKNVASADKKNSALEANNAVPVATAKTF